MSCKRIPTYYLLLIFAVLSSRENVEIKSQGQDNQKLKDTDSHSKPGTSSHTVRSEPVLLESDETGPTTSGTAPSSERVPQRKAGNILGILKDFHYQ